MLLLKLLQHVHLLLFIARRLPHLLLSLIIHHFLHHAPRLSIQITQVGILRRDLRDVNLRGGGYDMWPPFHLVHFIKVYRNFFPRRVGGRFKSPG